MSTNKKIPNFVNGIGVLNYTIESKSVGISEFYLPQVPNVQTYSYTNSPDYTAFGWLFGGNNININFYSINRIYRQVQKKFITSVCYVRKKEMILNLQGIVFQH